MWRLFGRGSGKSATAPGTYEHAFDLVERGRLAEAREALVSFVEREPRHLLARKELAVVLRRLGDRAGTLEQRRQLAKLDPADKVNRFNLANLLGEMGHLEEARDQVRQLRQMEPDNKKFEDLEATIVEVIDTAATRTDTSSQG